VGLGYVDAQKQLSQGGSPVMPGLEPGIQAAPSVVILRISALDARIKSAHDEAESAAFIFGCRVGRGPDPACRTCICLNTIAVTPTGWPNPPPANDSYT